MKGVIFHGLPGTGKTLVARKVAEALGSKNVRVVNGPEIMSKFVGDSERNLRELFSDADEAWAKDGAKSPLYVIIIDEIDAIMRNRGSTRDDSAARAVYDGVTTQMLAYMDGVKIGDNLLIIGLTNRLDALDPALLRPGRFEVQIRFPLPDRAGRRQVLDIHTSKLRENKFLAPDVDLDAIVDATASFSGADLAATVRSATSYAMARIYENAPTDGDALDDADIAAQFRVTSADMKRGMREVLATKSASANTEPYLKHGFVAYHERVSDLVERTLKLANDVKSGAPQHVLRVLLEGPAESGLTATAAAIARLAQFPHVHVFSPDALIGLTTDEKIEKLRQTFDAAAQAPSSCIVLDSIEHLLEYNGGLNRVNSNLQVELSALLRRRLMVSSRQGHSGGKAAAPKGAGASSSSSDGAAAMVDEVDGRIMVIATSSVADAVQTLGGGAPLFDAVEVLQPLNRADIAVVLETYNVEGPVSKRRELAARLPPAVPIKRLLSWLAIASSRARPSVSVLRPVEGAAKTLDVFAADTAASAAEEDGKTAAAKQPIPLATLSDVLTQFGVLDEVYAGDRLADLLHW